MILYLVVGCFGVGCYIVFLWIACYCMFGLLICFVGAEISFVVGRIVLRLVLDLLCFLGVAVWV